MTESAGESSSAPAEGAPAVTSLRLVYGMARAAPLMWRVVADRYRIEGVLGRGTTSIVCRATTTGGGEPVALKVLSPITTDFVDPAISDRFRFEARALAEVNHPNVVAVLDYGTTDDGLLYTVMELLEGETLGSLLMTCTHLDARRAVRTACEIAEGLHALHERGLLHRDVKPANVFIARDEAGREVVKVMDLGLGRALPSRTPSTSEAPSSGEGPRRRMNTEEGFILGTGPYMSPELIQGTLLDSRSDVYALGVVTYRMLTGTLPFGGSDLPELLFRHVSEPVEPLTTRAPSLGLTPALDRAVLRALEKDRERRPATALDFARELRDALDGERATDIDEQPEATLVPEGLASRRQMARRMVAGILMTAATLAGYAAVSRIPRRAHHVAATVITAPRAVVAVPLVVHEVKDPPQTAPAVTVRPHRPLHPPLPERALSAATATPPVDDLKVPVWRPR